MRWFLVFCLGVGGSLLGASAGRAQETTGTTSVILGAQGQPASVMLTDVNGGAAVFAEPGVGDPAVVANPLRVDVGFYYLQPFWDKNSLALTVPNGSNSSAGMIGATGDLTRSFAFVPHLGVDYQFANLGFGLASSADYIALNGSLQRTIATNTGSANLDASNSLYIVTLNLAEITKTEYLGDVLADTCLGHCRFLDDTLVTVNLGTRFNAIWQNYNANLSSGPNTAFATGQQNFAGLGLTGGLAFDHPCGEYWSLYSGMRGSVLIGQNDRKSTVSSSPANVTGDSPANTLTENKTDVLPVGEFELGAQMALPLNRRAPAANSGIFFLRVGLIGQFWGGAGFLSASQNHVRFSDRDLFLAGFSLSAGLLR